MSIYSFNYYYSLNEAAPIEIEQIQNLLDEKLFVSIGGGIGAGKSYLTKKYLNLPVIDVDNYVSDVGEGKYDRNNLSLGRKAFNTALMNALEGKESFVHVGTNANLNGTKNRLQIAKENGFTNILVFVDTPPEKALKYSQMRVQLDERNEILLERIIQSHNDAKSVFQSLFKDNSLVDFYVHIKN